MHVKHSTYPSPICHTAEGDSVAFGTEVAYHATVSAEVGKRLLKHEDIEQVESLPEVESDIADLPQTDSKDGATPRRGRRYQENVAPRRDNRNS
jgi:hypothetical protein